MIRGNHDRGTAQSWIGKGFSLVVPNHCFVNIGGMVVTLSHYPWKATPEELEKAKKEGYKLKHQDKRLEDNGGWLVHGHVHGHWKYNEKMINVGVDVRNFRPVHIEELSKEIKKGILENNSDNLGDKS